MGGDVAAVLLGHGLIVYFGLYLVIGYLMYASIFAGIGAFCETSRDAQTLLGPLMLTLTIPIVFMGQAIQHPDAPLLQALSWIPLFTPFLMVARAASHPPLWQVAGTLALMVGDQRRAWSGCRAAPSAPGPCPSARSTARHGDLRAFIAAGGSRRRTPALEKAALVEGAASTCVVVFRASAPRRGRLSSARASGLRAAARLRASLRARRTASAFWRARFSDGFS